MTCSLIKGADISADIYGEIKERIAKLKEHGVVPGLAAVMVGSDPASQVYVKAKEKKCAELGIRSEMIYLSDNITEEHLISKIKQLNADPMIHGYLIQLPLPDHIDTDRIINAIDPKKDIDCFHPENVGRMLVGDHIFLPATPGGVQQMLIRSGIETEGKHIVVVGRSNIVGKPMAALMMQRGLGGDATVTVVHSKSRDLEKMTRQADVLIVSIGKPLYVKKDMVKEGAVVIDVGINRIEDPSSPKGTRLVGDVDFDDVKDIVSAITPVPGGVGPMTICTLMDNVVKAAELSIQAQK